MILIGVSLFIVILFALYLNKQAHYIKLADLKQYTIDNREYLTEVSEQLLEWQEDKVEIYRNRTELPTSSNIDKLYSDIKIHHIFVEHNSLDSEDNVYITLKERKGNFFCGIYYSPSGKLLEYGTPQEGDRCENTGNRHIYRSEKICDNWYYYEDDTWN
ncbi:hypothetical protein [Butyrivibrio sp. INlla21]|uniref:hypothetical protein n=1 Tax=Butyrivibrio sp. INlla21 TaxID=1520811 RepID=UPI000B8163BA|nr:hypothetical protein [Butyrivibrio sp. INlla21]